MRRYGLGAEERADDPNEPVDPVQAPPPSSTTPTPAGVWREYIQRVRDHTTAVRLGRVAPTAAVPWRPQGAPPGKFVRRVRRVESRLEAARRAAAAAPTGAVLPDARVKGMGRPAWRAHLDALRQRLRDAKSGDFTSPAPDAPAVPGPKLLKQRARKLRKRVDRAIERARRDSARDDWQGYVRTLDGLVRGLATGALAQDTPAPERPTSDGPKRLEQRAATLEAKLAVARDIAGTAAQRTMTEDEWARAIADPTQPSPPPDTGNGGDVGADDDFEYDEIFDLLPPGAGIPPDGGSGEPLMPLPAVPAPSTPAGDGDADERDEGTQGVPWPWIVGAGAVVGGLFLFGKRGRR